MDNRINKSIIVKRDDAAKSKQLNEDEAIEKYEYILSTMEKLTIADFPTDIPLKSKQNIEKALRAVKMRKVIELGNGEALLGELWLQWCVEIMLQLIPSYILGLDEYRISNLQLTYQEKKFISERVQRQIDLDTKSHPKDDCTDKEMQAQTEKYIQDQREQIELTEKLLELRCEELELMLKIVDEIVSDKQKQQVQLQLENTKLMLMQIQVFNRTIQDSEMNKTSRSKEALNIISSHLDELLEKCKKLTD